MPFDCVIKPTHKCNFSCKYCYEDKIQKVDTMLIDTLENSIREVFAYVGKKENQKNPCVNFIWHGGEPLLAGLDFYHQALALQKKYSEKTPYQNTVQTNGSLIDNNWINFFRDNRFIVSVSLDGPRDIHDRARTRDNKRTFDIVMENVNSLRKNQIYVGAILVVSKLNKDYAEEIYDFFAKERLPFHFVPLTREGEATNNFEDIGLLANEYADFWIKMYDKWFASQQDQYIYCREFVHKSASILCGYGVEDCMAMKCCTDQVISIDADGSVYPCSTFSQHSAWKLGNINFDHLNKIMSQEATRAFYQRKTDPLCEKCNWQAVCYGGCCSRAEKFSGTIDNRDYYCPSFKKIYAHISKKLIEQKAYPPTLDKNNYIV